ncbi:MAG: hypothetical protein LDLANPLL_02831 [Turneriella sp.]|nr:hypothetical protein [Turneriella sp.]
MGFFVVGCVTQRTFVATSDQERNQVFDNIQSFIAQKNYNVMDANKGAGFIRAQKSTSNAALRVLSNVESFDQIQATIFQQGGKTSVRVQASSFQDSTNNFGVRNRNTTVPSESITRDAQEILAQFGQVSEVKGN